MRRYENSICEFRTVGKNVKRPEKKNIGVVVKNVVKNNENLISNGSTLTDTVKFKSRKTE
jgi:hypothetical protein